MKSIAPAHAEQELTQLAAQFDHWRRNICKTRNHFASSLSDLGRMVQRMAQVLSTTITGRAVMTDQALSGARASCRAHHS